MKSIIYLAVFFSGLLIAGCASNNKESQGANGDVYLTPAKGEYPSLAGLTRFVFKQNENGNDNHFTALKVRHSDQSTGLLLLWEEQHRLFFLGHVSATYIAKDPRDPVEESRWVGLSKTIDLTRDVVERSEDVDSSTYLVTRAWAEEIKQQCQLRGLKLVVPAFSKLETDN